MSEVESFLLHAVIGISIIALIGALIVWIGEKYFNE